MDGNHVTQERQLRCILFLELSVVSSWTPSSGDPCPFHLAPTAVIMIMEVCIAREQQSAQRSLQWLRTEQTHKSTGIRTTKYISTTTTFKYMPSNKSHITLYTRRNPRLTPGTNIITTGSAHARTHAHTQSTSCHSQI